MSLDPAVLGLYWAPREAVEIHALDMQDCFNHTVYEYAIKLSDCCLICTEADPRDGSTPAQPDLFEEIQGFRYWLDIQAVVGVEWIELEPTYCEMVLTPHLPSSETLEGDFWRWRRDPLAPVFEGSGDTILNSALSFCGLAEAAELSMVSPELPGDCLACRQEVSVPLSRP